MKGKHKSSYGWQLLPLFALLLAIASSVLLAPAAQAKTRTITQNLKGPLTGFVFLSCALGGAGEIVDLSGFRHQVFHTTFTDNGRVHVEDQENNQGIRGIGETS